MPHTVAVLLALSSSVVLSACGDAQDSPELSDEEEEEAASAEKGEQDEEEEESASEEQESKEGSRSGNEVEEEDDEEKEQTEEGNEKKEEETGSEEGKEKEEEEEPLPECQAGDSDVSPRSCGKNGRGSLPLSCQEGAWMELACEDPDECVDEETQQLPCWNGAGAILQTCVSGAWQGSECSIAGPYLATVSTAGLQSVWPTYLDPARISGDGRLVVISSFSDTLVDDDDNLTFDIFLRNIEAGTTTLISRSTFGVQADALSGEPDISAQGGHIVFVSSATNLLDDQTLSGGVAQVYLHDLQSGETSLLSTGWDGAPANGHCSSPAVSADGRYVAFASQASNLVSDDTNGGYDVFLHDTQTGATSRVSLTASGMQAVSATPSPNRSPRVALSADGRSVAFDWHTNGLVVEDTNDLWDVFVRDLQANTTQLVSTLQGGQANGRSGYPRISGDGRYVVYESEATNLHSSCIGYRGVLLFDRQTDTMECISVDFEGNAVPSILADDPDISADGRFVVFASGADNLVAVDNNDRTDIFVRDRQLSTLTMVNVTETGTQGDNSDGYPSISANGLNVAFVASSDNLVENDTNDERDILVVPAF